MTFQALAAYAAHRGSAFEVVPDAQASDYESGRARIGDETWHVRTARNTPTKPGAFVAFWRRGAGGTTMPFGADDGADDVGAGLLVFVEAPGRRGVFRFTRLHLGELGVTSGDRPGKRGFRVYPSWCAGLNAQATGTQRVQAPAFEEW